MKKYFGILLACLLACLPAAALAEAVGDDVIDAFSDLWVSDEYSVEIWFDDGAFHCRGTRYAADDEEYSWDFAGSRYDAGTGALSFEGGTMVRDAFDKAAGRWFEEETASGFGATLTVSADRRLSWTGSGDVIPDRVFVSNDEAEDGAEEAEEDAEVPGDTFEDSWVCDRATIDIEAEDGVYRVEITWAGSALEAAEWSYDCAFDEAAGALSGTGEKRVVTYDEDGEITTSETEYTDGGATFALDDQGRLLWADAVEDAGNGMAFERAQPEGDDASDYGPDPDGLPYVGAWACDRASLEIGTEDDAYRAVIRWANSAAEVVEWSYPCDVEDGGLAGYSGVKRVLTYGEGGEIIGEEEVYDDGEALFTLAGDGTLTWRDAAEDAGRDMVFERAAD